MIQLIHDFLSKQGMTGNSVTYFGYAIAALVVLIAAGVTNYIAKKIILAIITFIIKQTRTKYDDFLLERNVFVRLSHLAPAIVIYMTASWFGEAADLIQRLSMVYMMLAGLAAFYSVLNALVDIYNTFEFARQHQLKSYAQIIKIILAVLVGIIALSTIMDRSPLLLLSGFGAMTAVILLVFKDTILGLVASIQLSMNKMVQVGDWIEMPKYGADGDVIDITLHTVKVQNWDKTITTIPSYALISDTFKNWRGMSESGGRRIKRSINIDMQSIRFLDQGLLAKFDKIKRLKPYLDKKRDELNDYNKALEQDDSLLINGRYLTNIGTFRAYLEAYLREHPKVHQDMTFLIRQLQPTERGLPMEIYVFSNDQNWGNYENIQADIFDHILAVLPMFELRVYQYPTDYKPIVLTH